MSEASGLLMVMASEAAQGIFLFTLLGIVPWRRLKGERCYKISSSSFKCLIS